MMGKLICVSITIHKWRQKKGTFLHYFLSFSTSNCNISGPTHHMKINLVVSFRTGDKGSVEHHFIIIYV